MPHMASIHDESKSLLQEAAEPAIVVVDPISSGSVLAHQLLTRGYKVVRVWSDGVPDYLKAHTAPGLKSDFAATINCASLEDTVEALSKLPYAVRDVIVGCETGVCCADALAAALGVRGNSIEKSVARRNKFMQTEAMRSRGAAAAYQALCTSAEEVDAFLEKHAGFSKMVVKPNDGAGSEGVAICNSAKEVREAYASISGQINALGLSNTSVLLMEYLEGEEYVVDTVSRDGEHKVVAIWKYDKRVFFGSPVVYYGMHLLPMDAEPILADMVDYVVGNVLSALSITDGAVHTELIVTKRGPVLVEANCRLHGHDGGWVPISETCVGYSQVSALVDAYTSPDAFARLPCTPSASRGVMVFIRSPVAGVLSGVREDRLKTLRELRSFNSDRIVAPAVGEPIVVTKDLLSLCGNVLLANEDADAFWADYEVTQRIIDESLFEVCGAAA